MTARGQRKRTGARTGVIGLLAGAVAVTAFAAPAQAVPGERGERAKGGDHAVTQRAMDALVASGIPGVTAHAADRNGAWKGRSGIGDKRTGKPRGADDRFRIASITKTFVATVLLQMEAEGRLDLDDTVETWLPGMVRGGGNDGRKITVRQLLNHSSGIADYGNDPAYYAKYLAGFIENRLLTRTPQEAVDASMRVPAEFEPGAKHSYSNINYVLAALVLEKAAGRSYEAEVERRIVKPLKLRATTLPGNASGMPKPSSRAYSTFFDPSPTAKSYDVTRQNASQSWADGDMISSAADLNRFTSALLRGELLPPQQLKAMKDTLPSPGSGMANHGYGLGLERFTLDCDVTLWGHSGGWFGSLSTAYTTEDGRRSLSFNLNGDGAQQDRFHAVLNAEFCGTEPAPAAKR